MSTNIIKGICDMLSKNAFLDTSTQLKRILASIYGLSISNVIVIFETINQKIETYTHEPTYKNNNVYLLVMRVCSILNSQGFSENLIQRYKTHGFAVVLFYHTLMSIEEYDKDVLGSITDTLKNATKRKILGYVTLSDFCNSTKILCEYHDLGIIPKSKKRFPNKILSQELINLEEIYKIKIHDYQEVENRALRNRIYMIRTFLFHMEKHDVKSVKDFSHKNVNDSVTSLSLTYPNGVGSVLAVLRSFLSLLFEENITDVNYTVALPQETPHRRKLRFGFTSDEVTNILDSVDRKTSFGKRDYAIMLIAVRTGLRACDIAAIKLNDIDWHSNEIRIIQQKTGIPITLPLTAEVGNAIIDYFFYSRQKIDSPYMFPLHKSTTEHIKPSTLSMLTKKYMKIADVNESPPYRGIHSFRRSFAQRLLESSQTSDMLMEMLGQINVNSITPYTAIHEEGLKKCALSLNSIILRRNTS
jgi:integrase